MDKSIHHDLMVINYVNTCFPYQSNTNNSNGSEDDVGVFQIKYIHWPTATGYLEGVECVVCSSGGPFKEIVAEDEGA